MGWGTRPKLKDLTNRGRLAFTLGFVDDNDDDAAASAAVVGIGATPEATGFLPEVVAISESEEKKMGNLFGNGNLAG